MDNWGEFTVQLRQHQGNVAVFIAADGTPKQGVLRGPDSTGYYTPLANGDYALTRPKSKTFTIALFDAKSGGLARPRPCDGQRIDKQSKLMILSVGGGDESVDL
jgi:hypothetical protein